MTRNPDGTRDRVPPSALQSILVAVPVLAAVAIWPGCSRHEEAIPGDTTHGAILFQRHCSGCHPEGKNIIYPQKDLRRLTLAANGIMTPDAIVAVMRKPGKGMTRFDRSTISDDEAHAIARYVLEVFR